MNEQYVSFEVAKLLKEKGFDWECIGYYCSDEPKEVEFSFCGETNSTWEPRCCSAPTQQMACRWLREEYYIDILPLVRHVNKFAGELPIKQYSYRIYDGEGNVRISSRDWSRSYEKSIEAALQYCLTNLI